jgi:hypothetical protein
MIEFLFEEFLTENLGIVLKPFALVTLINGKRLQEVKMLIDSGADVTLLKKFKSICIIPLFLDLNFLDLYYLFWR